MTAPTAPTPPPALPPPAIDAHAHVFTRSMPLAPGAWHTPAADADAAQYIETLDRHGIPYGILAAASISGTNNDTPLAACRHHDRLRTTVILPPDCSLAEMKALAAQGVVGVRFQWLNRPDAPDLASGSYRQLIRHIAELGWHVQLHDAAFRLPAYLPALEAAGVKVVVDHFGRPDVAQGIQGSGFQRLLRSIEGGHTWVKLSAPFRLGSDTLVRQAAQALLAHAGAERLMWGSDWPFAAFENRFSYADALASLNELVPDAGTRYRIGTETPLKFYFGAAPAER